MRNFRARERRDEVHNDDNFDMVDVAMAIYLHLQVMGISKATR